MDSLPFQFQKRAFWEFFCPVCKCERRSFYWPSPRAKHYFMIALVGLVLTVSCWSIFEIKGIFMVFPIWGFFEFFYRAKARQSLICPNCGFDPYLYKHDAKLARQKIEEFFREKNKIKSETQTAELDSNEQDRGDKN